MIHMGWKYLHLLPIENKMGGFANFRHYFCNQIYLKELHKQQKIIDLQAEMISKLERIKKSEYQELLEQVREFKISADFKGLCAFHEGRLIDFEKELKPLQEKTVFAFGRQSNLHIFRFEKVEKSGALVNSH